jgi:nucleoside-diphosphate-sugar epimerase
MNIGITGVTGNLGRRLLGYLLARLNDSDQIYCLVRDTEKAQAMHQHSARKIIWVRGEITNASAVIDFVEHLDVCIHLASLVGFANKQDYERVNQTGTETLCAALVSLNPKCRLIHCSSIAVLRCNPKKLWLNTDYANSKKAGDAIVKRYADAYGLQHNIVYPGIIYGPEETNFIPTLSRYLKKGVVFFINGGEKHCPAVYIDDLCELFWQIIIKHPKSGQHFIGVGPQDYGIHQFISQLATGLNLPAPKIKLPKWLLLPIAIAMEKLYQVLHSTKAPLISKRSVDMLSINLSPALVHQYNQDFWTAHTGMDEGLQASLQWCKEQELV